jgi:hypothetical protein
MIATLQGRRCFGSQPPRQRVGVLTRKGIDVVNAKKARGEAAMKKMMVAVSVIMFTTTFIQEARAESCSYWYAQCRSRGGSHSYCAPRREACFLNGCWTEVSGASHCGLFKR